MKSRVNLYLEQLKPVKEFLPLKLVLSLWLLSAILVGLMTATFVFLNSKQQDNNVLLSEQLSSKQQEFAELAKEFSSHNNKAALILAKNKLMADIRRNERVVKTIHQQTESNRVGFSATFAALAQSNVDNLWLTEIEVNQAAIKLEGGAVHSTDIPKWIEGLKDSQQLVGQDFSSLVIQRAQDHLEFRLNNDTVLNNAEVAQ